MKKNYMKPEQRMVVLQHRTMLLQASPVTSVSNNAEMNYGGGSTGSARVKENNYNVWDDNWAE